MYCEYCKKNLYDKSSLTKHQSSKSCLKNINEENNIITFNCEFCDKKLASKQSLNRHLNTCKKKQDKKKDETSKLMDIIKNLEEEIKEIKETKPNIINNINTINNNLTINNIDFMSFMTSEKIKNTFDRNYNIRTMLGSKESLANFTVENFLSGDDKPIYLCSDKQRNNFYFLDKNNNRIDDTNAQILINLIIGFGFSSIQQFYTKHKNLKQNKNTDKLDIAFKDLMSLKKDGKDYINQLSNILPKTIAERQIRDNIIKKEEDDDVNEFIIEDSDEEINEIAGIPIEKLLKYKTHYINTGQMIAPTNIIESKESINKYKKFLSNF